MEQMKKNHPRSKQSQIRRTQKRLPTLRLLSTCINRDETKKKTRAQFAPVLEQDEIAIERTGKDGRGILKTFLKTTTGSKRESFGVLL